MSEITLEVNIATTDKNTRFVMPRLDANDLSKDRNAAPMIGITSLVIVLFI